MRARLAALLLAALVVSGCLPPGAELDDPSAEPLPDLAEPARPLPSATAPEPTDPPPVDDDVDASTDPAERPPAPPPPPETAEPADPAPPPPHADPPESGSPPPPSDGRTAAAPPPPSPSTQTRPGPVVLADVADPRRDAGLEARDYGDLTRVVFESQSDTLRVTVEVAGDLPARLGDGEVMGIGVDLFAGDGRESDHQLFADGGSDGWRAFLQTPEGFVAYPGSFGMGGRRLVFEVPWSAVGGRGEREASVFLDWSRERLPLNAQSFDRAPDRGRVRLRP